MSLTSCPPRHFGVDRARTEDRAGPCQAADGGLKVAGGRPMRRHLGAGPEVESLAGTPRGAPFSPTKKRAEDATNP
jgi:hypothetical protein